MGKFTAAVAAEAARKGHRQARPEEVRRRKADARELRRLIDAGATQADAWRTSSGRPDMSTTAARRAAGRLLRWAALREATGASADEVAEALRPALAATLADGSPDNRTRRQAATAFIQIEKLRRRAPAEHASASANGDGETPANLGGLALLARLQARAPGYLLHLQMTEAVAWRADHPGAELPDNHREAIAGWQAAHPGAALPIVTMSEQRRQEVEQRRQEVEADQRRAELQQLDAGELRTRHHRLTTEAERLRHTPHAARTPEDERRGDELRRLVAEIVLVMDARRILPADFGPARNPRGWRGADGRMMEAN